ncbi:helix-turn-helix transcriptional regulator [Actinomycetospora rhizophila]|uniref:Helix-turn-helix transcriptional regulator n=1 Tax=Actinomycetospora rhizophila TaxID=1416876 RepID=A0ABV9Z805_9PSEU
MSGTEQRRGGAGTDAGPGPAGVDVDGLADLLDDISAELEALGGPDRGAVTGDGPEASENRTVQGTQASLARAAARALRGEAGEARRAIRATLDDVQRAKDRARRAGAARPGVSDVPLADLERLARQALAVAGPVVWAELAVPAADGSVVTATAGRLPPAVAEALRAGPRAAVLRGGVGVAVEGADARWPELRSSGAGFLVLPLGVLGAVSLAAAEPAAFDEAARAIAREIAAHGAGLLTREGTGPAARAHALVVTASTLLARTLELDPSDGLDALLERATTAGSTILDSARVVVDELGPPGEDGTSRAPEPATLRRAIAYLEDHAAEEVDVAAVAAAAGLGVRGLQTTFRRWRGTTPLSHLREIRLARAHEELRGSDPRRTTVGDVAHRWRFSNPGRFSVTYRGRYGCSPGETLRA